MAASAYRAELKALAEKLWADPRYAEQAPQQTALIHRLYAATVLLSRPSGGDVIEQICGALPWLRKAIELDERTNDYEALKAAEQFFTAVAEKKLARVEVRTMLMHEFRVAMPEANAEEVEERVQEALKLLMALVAPTIPGGSSAKDDFAYLTAYQVGNTTVGQLMRIMQIAARGRFPEKDVDGNPIFAPLPNGNTKVVYTFHGATTVSFEWEVSKAKKLVKPLNDAARSLMELKDGQ